MRFVISCGLLVLLTACSGPYLKDFNPRSSAEKLFVAGLEDFSSRGGLKKLEKVEARYPRSKWAGYAASILSAQQAVKTEQAISAENAQANAELSSQLDALRQENLQLNETIEQLKKLLIELEQRAQ